MIYAIVRQRLSPKRNRIHPDGQTIPGDSDWTSRVTRTLSLSMYAL